MEEKVDTIFGRIVRKEIPAPFLYEDELCVVLKDIHPQAPIHLLVISKQEIPQLEDIPDDDDGKLLGHMMRIATKMAKEQKLDKGYRIVVNNGKEGGQHVYHLHIHILGGRQMNWPPG